MTSISKILSIPMVGGVLLIASSFFGCKTTVSPIVGKAAAVEAPAISIITSSNNNLYRQAYSRFIQHTDRVVKVFSLEGQVKSKAITAAMKKLQPVVVLALGSKAAQFARREFSEIPTIFAMVMNHRRLPELAKAEVAGIEYQVSPAMEFIRYRLVLPGLRRVLTFYSPQTPRSYMDEVVSQLGDVGIELVAIPVSEPKGVSAAIKANLENIDGIWYLPDPLLLNATTFGEIKILANENQLPFFSPASSKLTEAGALMSVSVDFTSLGPQAAHIIKRILEQNKPASEIGIEAPIGGEFVVNLAVAKQLGIKVPKAALPVINRFVGAEVAIQN